MPLLNLPNEILDMYFEFLVREDIRESFKARSVWRKSYCITLASIHNLLGFFKRNIEMQMITNTPLSHFRSLDSPGPRSWIGKEQNAYAFLEYRIEDRPGRPDGSSQLPTFVRMVTDELMHFVPLGVNESDMRKQYQIDLLRVLASEQLIWHLFERSPQSLDVDHAGNPVNTYFDELASAFIRGEGRDHCLLAAAAAAAVENVDALQTYLKDSEMLLQGCILFESVWHAAVKGDKFKSLQFLLGRLETHVPVSNQEQTFHGSIPETIYQAFHTAIVLGNVRTANTIIDLLVKQNWLDVWGDTDVMQLVEWMMEAGSIRIFEHALHCIFNIAQFPNYEEHLRLGFVSASRNGHGEFVRHLLKNNRVPHIRDISDGVLIWRTANIWNWYEVQNPLLAAAQHSRLSVIEAFIRHDPALVNYDGLIEAAVLGTTSNNSLYSLWNYKDYRKTGSRHATAQFLFNNGMAVTGNIIKLTNYFAKMLLAHKTITGDCAMTLIILLVALKRHFDHKKLRKQMHVPVKNALQRILDFKPEMRPLGVQDCDFSRSLKDLHAWLAKRG
jgi:hypothetical protein